MSERTITDWTVRDVHCSAPVADSDNECKQGYDIKTFAQEVKVEDGAFQVTLDNLALTGKFDTRVHVSGTWTFLPESCCTATGTWEAEVDEIPEPDPTTSTDDTGATTDIGDTGDTTLGGDTGPVTTGDVGGTGGELPPPVEGEEYAIAADANAAQKEAMSRTNWYRKNAGVDLIDNVGEINVSAQAHADYFSLHVAAYQAGKIPGGAHAEDPSYAEGFTGKDFGKRMKAAGYSGTPGFEVMAFINNPSKSVDGWMETVYHRIPFMSPDSVHTGYGGAATVDVMNFGYKGHPDKTLAVLYPWPGQTNVPKGWSGNEGPQPPPPPNGYPSGPVITVTTAGGAPLTISEHKLLDAGGAEIPHVWLPKDFNGFLSATWAMYADDPLPGASEFTVVLTGKHGPDDWSRTWTFTTRK